MFLDELRSKHGHDRATLLLHTDPNDAEGANLHHVIELLSVKNNVLISNEHPDIPQMNELYNCIDVLVNISSNEGFGLPVLEAKMCAKPVITIKTGGLTRQVEDHETGEQYGVALEPDLRSLIGSQFTPYIWEDFVKHEALARAMLTVFEWGPEKRKYVGTRAMQHALRDYSKEHLIRTWDETLTKLVNDWRTNPKKRWERIEL
jgi:glycosyltransferase involved in cell wall biosynthesis